MGQGVNKVNILGNLGAEPETRYTQSGSAVANFRVATSISWKDKQTGDKKEETEWHRVVAFGRLAEIVGEYLHKGSKVYIDGRIRTRKWQNREGQDQYTTEIVANEMQMLDSRGSGQQGPAYTGGTQQRQAPPQNQAPPQQQANMGLDDDLDDDIPF